MPIDTVFLVQVSNLVANDITNDKYDIDEIVEEIQRQKTTKILNRFTTNEINDHFIYGYYLYQNHHQYIMPMALIKLIQQFYGIYHMSGWMTMTLKEVVSLNIGDKLDHRDQVGRFVLATIIQKDGNRLKIHYDGWSKKWDVWSDLEEDYNRFAKAGSVSDRPITRTLFKCIQIGDNIDINPILRHPGWKCGKIRRFDRKSGQIQVVYQYRNRNYLYWAHPDNPDEIAKSEACE